jgi:hypothetical protein
MNEKEPVFCKNCKHMVFADTNFLHMMDKNNMRCSAGVEKIYENYVTGEFHWNVPSGLPKELPLCYLKNKDGACPSYVPVQSQLSSAKLHDKETR